jgi:predicted nucleic acid-binding protein
MPRFFSYCLLFYRKKSGPKAAFEKIYFLTQHIEILSLGPIEVIKVTGDKKITDFEDGLQYYAALNSDCRAIISEDLNDFFFSNIPVYSSKYLIMNILYCLKF